MKRHTARRRKAHWIEAAAAPQPFVFEAAGVDWIQAQAADGNTEAKPKRFAMTAYTGGALQVSAYGLPVVIDLAGLTAQAPVPILLDHDHSSIVGHAEEIDLAESHLKLKGVVSGASPASEQVTASAAMGFPWRASVGARPDKLEFVGEDVSTKVNGKQFKGPLYVARKATLGEVSFVAVAADSRTSAKVAASAAHSSRKEEDMNFEQWLLAMGLVYAELRDDQKAKLQAKYDGELKSAAKKTGEPIEAAAKTITAPTFDLSAIVLAHEKHMTTIEATAAEYAEKVAPAKMAELKAAAAKGAIEAKSKALNEEWAAPRLEAEHIKAAALFRADLMVAERPKGPAIHASNRDLSGAVIEAALCQSLAIPKIEASFKPDVLEQAHSAFRGRLGLQQVILTAAASNGYPIAPGERIRQSNCREVLRYAFTPIHASATLSLPGIFSNVANKELLAGFEEEDQVWREISAIRTVSDFKTVTSYRLLDEMEYEELPPDGTMKHGAVSEESYTRQARTYAKMFSLSRQDIVNDDLGAFDDLRTRLGRGAARKFNNVFWAKFINNSTFFTAARANYISGATTTLLTDFVGLQAGIEKFDKLASAAVAPATKGKRIGGTPTILLVPPELEAVAIQIFTPIAAADAAKVNPYAGKFRPVKAIQLSDSTFTGNSATAWYLLRNPAILAPMVVSFLDGVQQPIVESADADFNQLGIQFRGYHDFGCDQAEWLCGIKSKGAA